MGLGLEFQPPAEQMQSMIEPMQLTEFEHEGEKVYEFEDVSRALAKYVVMQHHDCKGSDLESAEQKNDALSYTDDNGGIEDNTMHALPSHLSPLDAPNLKRQRDLQIISEREKLSGRLGQFAGQVKL